MTSLQQSWRRRARWPVSGGVALSCTCVFLAGMTPMILRAAAGGRPPRSADAAPQGLRPLPAAGSPRVALFAAEGFPSVDAPPIARTVLDAALAGLPVERLSTPADIQAKLDPTRADVLLLPYGSAFPLDAWESIRAYLREGGGLVVLGGAPFDQPVIARATTDGALAWSPGRRQTAFAHDLLIGPAEPVQLDNSARVVRLAGWDRPIERPRTTWALTVRFATQPDLAGEEGAAGPRDALLRPLVQLTDATGVPRGCALVEIDRLRGSEAGGRWLLATSDAPLGGDVIREAVLRAGEGAVDIEARPLRAAIDPGEQAAVRITVRRPRVRPGERPAVRAGVVVRDDHGTEVLALQVDLVGPAQSVTGTAVLRPPAPFAPGLYHVDVAIPDVAWHPRSSTTGFWVRDRQLLASAPALSVSADWLRRDGAVFPVVGSTYMASDVHRKFLFEPNPDAWDRDFAAMKRQGVNLVRTGLWTAWQRLMLDPGAPDESALDALDAFVLTAAKHRIPVCFTFFAFLPPAFGASNPYLDPRALDGQRDLLTTVAARYRDVGWIHYDLINEPSYAPPDKLWQTRPFGDRAEARAWQAWVGQQYGHAAAGVRNAWGDEGDVDAVPADTDFTYGMVAGGRHARKAGAFVLFTQGVVAEWAARLRDVLRAAGGGALVTLGQDEGGTATRPAPPFHAGSVDYTSVHTWWNNDDLLWDAVVTKVPGTPHLVEETGLMRLEDRDGFPWRTPAEAEALLERKFAYALAARAAGAVEWTWNVNPYQPIDNEAVIGLVRPDGTMKPEAAVLRRFAAFLDDAAPYLDDFDPSPVVIVLPHRRAFAGRPGGLDAVKAVVRVLAERFAVVPSVRSDLLLGADQLRGVRLAVVPSPEWLGDSTAAALAAAARGGTRILMTGGIEAASGSADAGGLQALGLDGRVRPLARRERVEDAGEAAEEWVTFPGTTTEFLRRGTTAGFGEAAPHVWYDPLPIEFASEEDVLVRRLRAALGAAGVDVPPARRDRTAVSVLAAPRAWLVVAVNESSAHARTPVRLGDRELTVPVPAGRARLVLVERPGGRLLADTPGERVAIRALGPGRTKP